MYHDSRAQIVTVRMELREIQVVVLQMSLVTKQRAVRSD